MSREEGASIGEFPAQPKVGDDGTEIDPAERIRIRVLENNLKRAKDTEVVTDRPPSTFERLLPGAPAPNIEAEHGQVRTVEEYNRGVAEANAALEAGLKRATEPSLAPPPPTGGIRSQMRPGDTRRVRTQSGEVFIIEMKANGEVARVPQ